MQACMLLPMASHSYVHYQHAAMPHLSCDLWWKHVTTQTCTECWDVDHTTATTEARENAQEWRRFKCIARHLGQAIVGVDVQADREPLVCVYRSHKTFAQCILGAAILLKEIVGCAGVVCAIEASMVELQAHIPMLMFSPCAIHVMCLLTPKIQQSTTIDSVCSWCRVLAEESCGGLTRD